MSEITSGSLAYTTPRPFESPSATVTLGFTIDDQAGAEAFIAGVGQMARRQAHRALVAGAPEPIPETTKRTRGPNKLKETAQADAPFGESSQPPVSQDTIPGNGGGFGEQTAVDGQNSQTGAGQTATTDVSHSEPQDWSLPNAGEPAAVEIPDIDLTQALNKKALELGGNARPLIFELLAQYVGKGQKEIHIPQARRAEFLEQVHALKAN